MSDTSAPPALAPSYTYRMSFPRPGPSAWLRVEQAATLTTVRLNGRLVGTHLGAWTPFEFDLTPVLRDENELEIVCEDQAHGTNGFLPVVGVRWAGLRGVSINLRPTPPTAPAPQRSRTDGLRLLVDGRPCRVRGILHWGYYPAGDCAMLPDAGGFRVLDPKTQPAWPGDDQIRREITELQSLGFNLVKFCLWVPPTRYLELCDELGMLVWQEYPVWASPLRDDSLLIEFREMLERDRPYPCVILRSFTCENDHVAPEISRRLVDLAHETIPGCLAIDNSGWLCNEHAGDFHDEHPYVHNALWGFYGRRMRDRLSKPLLLGETMVADTFMPAQALDDAELKRSYAAALAMRRWQIETLARELPDAGYCICGIRDTVRTPLGIYTNDGRLKYSPDDWSWHRDRIEPSRIVPPLTADAPAPLIGPRKGQWKCSEHTWWTPVVRVHDASLPADLIHREAAFELLSGRVLTHTDGTRVLVELIDVHSHPPKNHPLVIEFRTQGEWRIVSAFRSDTPAGRQLRAALDARKSRGDVSPPPEIGPLAGTAIVLEDWEMWIDPESSSILRDPGPLDRSRIAGPWKRVKCDTPLVNRGETIFEGWAIFRSRFTYPGGRRTLHCESVADYFELYINGEKIGEAGPRHGTWDGTRDVPRDFGVHLAEGSHEIVFRARDWRAAGGMVGPIYFAADLAERIL